MEWTGPNEAWYEPPEYRMTTCCYCGDEIYADDANSIEEADGVWSCRQCYKWREQQGAA